ncbi:hypothetical protein D3C86_1895770 [compost metagenome]
MVTRRPASTDQRSLSWTVSLANTDFCVMSLLRTLLKAVELKYVLVLGSKILPAPMTAPKPLLS